MRKKDNIHVFQIREAGQPPDSGRGYPSGLSLIKKRIFVGPGCFPISSGDSARAIFIHRHGIIQRISADWIDFAFESEGSKPHCVYGVTETLSVAAFTFSVRTITPALFDVIDRDDFFTMALDRPELIQRLNFILSGLYKNGIRRISENCTSE